jgi:septum formation inhibitor-activating ATPase MinD
MAVMRGPISRQTVIATNPETSSLRRIFELIGALHGEDQSHQKINQQQNGQRRTPASSIMLTVAWRRMTLDFPGSDQK